MTNNNGQKLAGQVAVVTGGSRGIGAAITKRLAADGASVAFTYAKGADAAVSVVKEIERSGGKAIAIQADAADADAVKAAVEKAVAIFGRLDVLVNNAGTATQINDARAVLPSAVGDPIRGVSLFQGTWKLKERFNVIEIGKIRKTSPYPHTLMQGNYGGHVKETEGEKRGEGCFGTAGE
jgi:NAD(P)-dependent dehydrogenase (short-subunit alcohol dehydrogenase family)